MPVFASFLLLAATTATTVAAAPSPAPADAQLAFVARGTPLAGISFGIEAVDGQRSGYGGRMSTRVLAGRRTVWYSCPGQPAMDGGSRMSFDFEAGRRYELACEAGKQAVIRPADC